MQLYVDRQRAKSEALLRRVEGLGLKAVFVTVDAAAPGKREADERGRAEIEVVRLTLFSFAGIWLIRCVVVWNFRWFDQVRCQGRGDRTFCRRIYRSKVELERYRLASTAYGSADWA